MLLLRRTLRVEHSLHSLTTKRRCFAMSAEPNGLGNEETVQDKADASSQRQWREVKIEVPWGHISGKWWGPAYPQPVLALHGWQDNAGTWDNLIPLLPPKQPILAIDLPGHGLSSHYPPGQFYYLSWDGPLLIRRIVKHFGWKTVTILGHSLGGIIGFMYAAIFPSDITKLIQVDIANPTIRPADTIPKIAADVIDKFLHYEKLDKSMVPCYGYKDMLDIVEDAYKGAVDKEACEVLMRRGMAPSPKGDGYLFARDVRLKVAGLGFLSIEHSLALASQVRCPVLNIRATPIQSFDKAEYYTQILDKIRENAEVEYHEVPGTHHLHLVTPERVAPLISAFLMDDTR